MKQLNIKCGCETAADIEVSVLNGVVPIAQITCVQCGLAYFSIGVKVTNA
jgi:hypothetical protein